MITNFNHIQISVPSGNADEVRRFYGNVLGLPEIPVPQTMTRYGLIWFAVGDRQLHIGIEDNINRLATRTHIAYEVNDIAAWREKLVKAGLELQDQPLITGWDRFHILDPFGNRIEIIGRTAETR